MTTTNAMYRRAACCLPRWAASLYTRIRRGCPAPAPLADDAKTRLLAEVGPDLRATLERMDAHFILTAAAIAESGAKDDVLAALCELLAANTDQLRRRNDAATAELATLRRHGLRLVKEPQQKETP